MTTVLQAMDHVLLVMSPGREAEAAARLAAVGRVLAEDEPLAGYDGSMSTIRLATVSSYCCARTRIDPVCGIRMVAAKKDWMKRWQ